MAELRCQTAKTAIVGIAIRQISHSIIVSGVETRFKTHVSNGSDFGSYVVDQKVEMVDSLNELKS